MIVKIGQRRVCYIFVRHLRGVHKAYLVATGLKNYHLTKYDEEVLDRFNKLSENSLDRQN